MAKERPTLTGAMGETRSTAGPPLGALPLGLWAELPGL